MFQHDTVSNKQINLSYMNTTSKVINIPVYKNLSLKNIYGEKWKPISGYSCDYMVSNKGRVKSLKNINDKILKQNISNSGYLKVVLSKNSRTKNHDVHRLVSETFLEIKNECVNHKNRIKTDNKLNNLEWVSIRYNTNHGKINNSSKYHGVSFNKNQQKWKASIFYNNKKNHLGYFVNEIDAHKAYQKELIHLEYKQRRSNY